MLKAKINEEVGLPAGKQKLQYEVSDGILKKTILYNLRWASTRQNLFRGCQQSETQTSLLSF